MIDRETAATERKKQEDDLKQHILQTKLHLRYPIPGTKRVQWVEPHGVEIHQKKHFTTTQQQQQQQQDPNSSSNSSNKGITIVNIIGSHPSPSYFKVHDWKIASGDEEDYIWVQSITVIACLVGVLIMLRDISYVSKWDST